MAVCFIPIVGPILSCVIDGTFVDMFKAIMKGDWATVGLCALAFVPGMKGVTKGLKAFGAVEKGVAKGAKAVGRTAETVTIKKGTTLYRIGGVNEATGRSFRHGESYTTERLSMYTKSEIKAGTGPLNPDNPANTVYKFTATRDIDAYYRTSKGGYFPELVIPGGGNDDMLKEVMRIDLNIYPGT